MHLVVVGAHLSVRLHVLAQNQHGLIRTSHSTVPRNNQNKASHLSGSVEATADNIEEEPDQPVQHPCRHRSRGGIFFFSPVRRPLRPGLTGGGEDAPDDSAQPHQELPERHVLLGDRHRQGAGVVLHEDARNTVTARGVVDHSLLENTPTSGDQTSLFVWDSSTFQ